jgi:hypothetical protein
MKRTIVHIITIVSPLVAPGLLASACQDEPSHQGAAGAGGSGARGGSGSLESAWEGGACGQAVVQACAPSLGQCAGDPGCARQLECMRQCPPPAREPDASACAAQCRPPAGSGAEATYEGLTRCIEQAERDACERSEGTVEDASRHPLLEQECPASEASNACDFCEDTRCCQSYADCINDPTCSAFNQCMKACTDPSLYACELRCEAEHPGGLQKYAPRLTCVGFRCGEQGQCSDEPRSACGQCLYSEKCARVTVECDIDPQCHLLSICWAECDTFDGPCQQACYESHPGAKQRFNDALDCQVEVCGIHCLG